MARPMNTKKSWYRVFIKPLKTQNILKKDCEIKLLVGCNEEETYEILEFLNQTEFQKAILVRRGDEVPEWASND